MRHPDASVRLAWVENAGEVQVQIVDVSVNGAAFVLPEGREVQAGERLAMELVHAGTPASALVFEVLDVQSEAERRLARGRFLPPGGGAPGEVELTAEEVAGLLG